MKEKQSNAKVLNGEAEVTRNQQKVYRCQWIEGIITVQNETNMEGVLPENDSEMAT